MTGDELDPALWHLAGFRSQHRPFRVAGSVGGVLDVAQTHPLMQGEPVLAKPITLCVDVLVRQRDQVQAFIAIGRRAKLLGYGVSWVAASTSKDPRRSRASRFEMPAGTSRPPWLLICTLIGDT